MGNNSKVILDLCGNTGSWSKPYRAAGYDVRVVSLPEYDVRTYEPPEDVYGILAAPPCTMFSFARTRAKLPRDLQQGMETVIACLNIIWECQYKVNPESERQTTLKFWALENPFGMLRSFLGIPAFIFHPYDFGDRYQKKTCLWGNFNIPKKEPVELTPEEKIKFGKHIQQLPDLEERDLFNPGGCVLPENLERRKMQRAVTPPGFANAFYEENK